jgi:hypothetical protein
MCVVLGVSCSLLFFIACFVLESRRSLKNEDEWLRVLYCIQEMLSLILGPEATSYESCFVFFLNLSSKIVE